VFPHGGLPISVLGGPVVRRSSSTPTGFPSSYDGTYFYFEIFSGTLHRLRETSEGWDFAEPAPGQPDSTTWGSGFAGASDAEIGPDGALYFTSCDLAGSPARGLHRIGKRFVEAPFDSDRELTAFPNPTRSGAVIRHDALSPGAAQLSVYEATGRLVQSMRVRTWAGSLFWDGTDELGRPLPAGTFFLRLETDDGFRGEGKLTLLR
jgi:hypothetical protein